MNQESTEKLQKVLARAGFGSRRELEGWIEKGRVKVNGKVAQLGIRVSESDRVVVDGKKLAPQNRAKEERRVILYNKPEDEITTRKDPMGRPTVFAKLPPLKHGRWVSIGRLDINTSGLLLFTTDGELANKLMHPSSEVEREYAVRVLGDVTPEMVQQMHKGVMIEDHLCRFTDIQHYGGEGVNQWYHVVLVEGRNREVRKLWESQGLKVSRLKRVRFGPLFIPSTVTKGKYQELSKPEIDKLFKLANPKAAEKAAKNRSAKPQPRS
ncbi:MAG: pseudouridine synthase [Gammaproteobacteria bacterium]|jgi:23S rRNA pseudouridine2605 synthase|nr:pseudouridine synthase [Gammaproteobacteria bacterium]MBT3859532.1 pseudouridine synthase [Gammaproteobacteria bacterium]MBT3986574.1 pseudouridine synthase [Gammaproteobacteria bacterium]MBT4581082.1 pseudouridine synthase [Gammaproteobacteria bacterium]MBT4659999.1 pseudouridine synthase [Gammaproteobacteria bacterium]